MILEGKKKNSQMQYFFRKNVSDNKKKMFVFWIFFFIFQFHCLDIYVVSPAISNCLLNSSCDGSKLTPFNDLYSAFQAGVSMAIKNNDPIINYYLLANEILTGFLLPNYTIYNGSGSLFEGYSG